MRNSARGFYLDRSAIRGISNRAEESSRLLDRGSYGLVTRSKQACRHRGRGLAEIAGIIPTKKTPTEMMANRAP